MNQMAKLANLMTGLCYVVLLHLLLLTGKVLANSALFSKFIEISPLQYFPTHGI